MVQPTRILAYYLVAGRDPKSIKPFPTGLRVVTDRDAGVVGWACIGGGPDAPDQAGTVEQETPPDCEGEAHLVQRIHFPDCWDGHNLDSADHRSHMAYASTVTSAGGASGGASAGGASAGGRRACPATHPVPVPHLRLGVHYPDGVGGADVTLSSGGPETSHADFFNAWDPTAQARLVTQCLNAARKCGAKGPELLVQRAATRSRTERRATFWPSRSHQRRSHDGHECIITLSPLRRIPISTRLCERQYGQVIAGLPQVVALPRLP